LKAAAGNWEPSVDQIVNKKQIHPHCNLLQRAVPVEIAPFLSKLQVAAE